MPRGREHPPNSHGTTCRRSGVGPNPTYGTSCRGYPKGFTVIELLAVLVLSALLAGLAAVAMTGRGRAVRVEDATRQMIAYERNARRNTAGATAIVYDLRRREIRLDGPDPRRLAPPLRLVGGLAVEEVQTAAGRVDTGVAAIPLNRDGRTPTYAVRIGKGDAARWLLFVGLTGRSLELENEQQARDILATTAGGDDPR